MRIHEEECWCLIGSDFITWSLGCLCSLLLMPFLFVNWFPGSSLSPSPLHYGKVISHKFPFPSPTTGSHWAKSWLLRVTHQTPVSWPCILAKSRLSFCNVLNLFWYNFKIAKCCKNKDSKELLPRVTYCLHFPHLFSLYVYLDTHICKHNVDTHICKYICGYTHTLK